MCKKEENFLDLPRKNHWEHSDQYLEIALCCIYILPSPLTEGLSWQTRRPFQCQETWTGFFPKIKKRN